MTDGRPIVRRVLVLSPRFVPTDSVDLHRIRANIGHYREFGWEPTVLAVQPDLCGRPVLPELARTVPADLDVRHCGAVPLRLAGRLGVTALGIRAFFHMLFAGLRLLRRERFDLVYVTTTEFLAMPLAAIWRRLTGVPFVLDFQDPWASDYEGAGTGDFVAWKYRLMRRIHAVLERWTARGAAGIIAVSPAYVDVLRRRYPALRDRPCAVIPFGFPLADFDAADESGRIAPAVGSALAEAEPGLAGGYFGRIGSDMESALDRMFAVLRAGRDVAPETFGNMRICLVGTSYQPGPGARGAIGQRIVDQGLSGLLSEQPERIPYLDALRSLRALDFVLVLGSDDPAYVPSKLAQTLAAGRRIIAFAGSNPAIGQVLDQVPTALVIPADLADVEAIARRLHLFLTTAAGSFEAQEAKARMYGAAFMAAREVEVFDSAIA
ncbi:MAG: glycosyltransferase [Pseudomonadota bacterium]|nr:glycosyltransferase [Pseudomonadota bacterium]